MRSVLKSLMKLAGDMRFLLQRKRATHTNQNMRTRTFQVTGYHRGFDEQRRRLMALGILPGKTIKVLYDPQMANMVVICLGSWQMALRKSLWQSLHLEEVDHKG